MPASRSFNLDNVSTSDALNRNGLKTSPCLTPRQISSLSLRRSNVAKLNCTQHAIVITSGARHRLEKKWKWSSPRKSDAVPPHPRRDAMPIRCWKEMPPFPCINTIGSMPFYRSRPWLLNLPHWQCRNYKHEQFLRDCEQPAMINLVPPRHPTRYNSPNTTWKYFRPWPGASSSLQRNHLLLVDASALI